MSLDFLSKRVLDFMKQDASIVTLDQWDKLIMDPLITGCKSLKRYGGEYQSYCHVLDGQKYVCMDDFPIKTEDVSNTD